MATQGAQTQPKADQPRVTTEQLKRTQTPSLTAARTKSTMGRARRTYGRK